MINTLFIDLDGTLVNSSAAVHNLFENLAERYLGNENLGKSLRDSFKKSCGDMFYTLPHTRYLQDIACGWDNIFLSDFTGEDSRLVDLKNAAAEYKYSVVASVLAEHGIKDCAVIESMIAFIYEKWVEYYRPYSDIDTFLYECKGFKKYILTNGFVDIQMKKIHHCGLYDKFDGVFISGIYGIGKPHAAYFEYVLDNTRADVNSTVMIGDRLSSDIIGAANMGIKTILKKHSNSVNDKRINPTAIVEKLAEIPSLLLSV